MTGCLFRDLRRADRVHICARDRCCHWHGSDGGAACGVRKLMRPRAHMRGRRSCTSGCASSCCSGQRETARETLANTARPARSAVKARPRLDVDASRALRVCAARSEAARPREFSELSGASQQSLLFVGFALRVHIDRAMKNAHVIN